MRNPQLEFRCTDVSIPTITLSPAQSPSPMTRIPYWGDHMEYGQLNVEFLVDERMDSFIEILRWLEGLGAPHDRNEFIKLKDSKKTDLFKGLKSDISISVMSSAGKFNREFIFSEAFPVYLGGFNLTTRGNEPSFITSTAAFAYTNYTLT